MVWWFTRKTAKPVKGHHFQRYRHITRLFPYYFPIISLVVPYYINVVTVGKPSINGPCLMAMLNNQRVIVPPVTKTRSVGEHNFQCDYGL